MKRSCLVGNILELPGSFRYLLNDDTVVVLATKTSGINSCYHEYFAYFNDAYFDRCIVIFGESYAKHVHYEYKEPYTITPTDTFSKICFTENPETGKENDCYMFRMFLLLWVLCKIKDIPVEVIFDNQLYTDEDFLKNRMLHFGDPQLVNMRSGFSLYSYHNSHNEYITNYLCRPNLLIVLGDSWVVADNKDTSPYWHCGQLKHSFAQQVADELDSDLVVCGSPGNSNAGAFLNFVVWYLHNPDFTNQYKDVKIIFSTTSVTRDFTVNGNIGNWSSDTIHLKHAIMRTEHSLFQENRNIITMFIDFCRKHSLPFYFLYSHSKYIHDYISSRVTSNNIICPSKHGIHNYNQLFADSDYLSSCGHPSIKGNQYLAGEVIKKLKGI